MFSILSRWIARANRHRIRSVEAELGYRLVFTKIPSGWLGGVITLELTRRWKSFGLRVRGLDYFTMGSVIDRTTSRFDQGSDQFQSWIGGYLIRSEEKWESLQDSLNLAIVDQYDWLKHYGDPNPGCRLRESSFRNMGEIRVSGYTGTLFEGGGVSRSELVSLNSPGPWLRFVTGFMAESFNLSDPRLRCRGSNFIPVEPASSALEIYIKGYFAVIPLRNGVTAVLYANGAVYRNQDGFLINTFDVVAPRLLDCLSNVRIEKSL